MEVSGSRAVAQAALMIAMTNSREEEKTRKEFFCEQGITVTAVDYGGEANFAMKTIIERAVVAAKRERLINECHAHEGAIAGAAHEAVMQILSKAMGLNLGGKVGLARHGEHLCVAVFFSVGLIHLDEVAVGLSHRAIQ